MKSRIRMMCLRASSDLLGNCALPISLCPRSVPIAYSVVVSARVGVEDKGDNQAV